VVPALWLRSGKGPGGIEIITPDRVLEDRRL